MKVEDEEITQKKGIGDLKSYVDTLIVIPNDKLLNLSDDKTPLTETFKKTDDILFQAVKGIAELISVKGLINLDFADVKTVMLNKGMALMGVGVGEGRSRVVDAVSRAVSSPLLENTSIKGATGIIVNMTGSSSLSLTEVNQAISLLTEEADPDADIIVGAVIDENKKDSLSITVIATGFDGEKSHHLEKEPKKMEWNRPIAQKNSEAPFLSKWENKEKSEVSKKNEKPIVASVENQQTSFDEEVTFTANQNPMEEAIPIENKNQAEEREPECDEKEAETLIKNPDSEEEISLSPEEEAPASKEREKVLEDASEKDFFNPVESNEEKETTPFENQNSIEEAATSESAQDKIEASSPSKEEASPEENDRTIAKEESESFRNSEKEIGHASSENQSLLPQEKNESWDSSPKEEQQARKPRRNSLPKRYFFQKPESIRENKVLFKRINLLRNSRSPCLWKRELKNNSPPMTRAFFLKQK